MSDNEKKKREVIKEIRVAPPPEPTRKTKPREVKEEES